MKTIHIIFNLLLTICIVGLLDSCQSTNVDVNPTHESYFLLKNVRGEILKEVDPDILALVKNDLINKDRKDDASKLGDTYDFKTGKLLAGAKTYNGGRLVSSAQPPFPNDPILQYAHVQNIGWMDPVLAGQVAGTTGQALGLEAFYITGVPGSPWMQYQAHVSGIGWQAPQYADNPPSPAGTVGQHRSIEAIRFFIDPAWSVSISYRAHVSGIGWLPWVGNQDVAGTTGQNRKLEAFQLSLVYY
ncbi:hypothetical protein [Spirosoma endophyticum]|uniref:Hydrophobic W protein n=1 Tax=Spirosoma endophyticum TaxID=662367 RepID=A0A1I2BDK2_9BACT|nr:hypothetical protein [Spirosoma endophyticum]SFE54176.1 hydrophobic W protein [Spirosoma endophyticum]